ncbi:MAG TPA: thioredoxin domain-containing protein [Gemmatimonadaceae bacterium]|nr:thioredoxin domain-containing protein [Gemmatimonadaceae bacterium]
MSAGRLTPPVRADDHAAGPADAPVTLVEYGDFECPYCGMAYPIVKSVQRKLGPRLRFVYRNFPLRESHPHAQHAAEAAEAAGAQGKYWAMHDALFEHQAALEDDDLVAYARALGLDAERVARELAEGTHTARVRADFRSGVRSGVNGTPTFFVNGERYDGTWSDEGRFLRDLRAAAESAEAGAHV